MLNISADEQEKQRRKTTTATGDATMTNGPRVGMAAVFRCGTSQDMVAQQSVPAFRSAAEILCLAPRTRCMFEGYLVHWNGEQKSVKNRTPNSPSKNNESTDSESVAVDMLLGDDTGPIFTTLWNDAASAFIEQCDALNRAEDGGGLDGVVINLDVALVTVVPKNNWNGTCLTAVRNLQSVPTIKLEQAQL